MKNEGLDTKLEMVASALNFCAAGVDAEPGAIGAGDTLDIIADHVRRISEDETAERKNEKK